MDLSTFLQQRRPDWRRLEEILERVENSGPLLLSDDEAVTFGRLYRRTASDLNQAQTFVSGEATVRFLNDLVARAYLAIYGNDPVRPWAAIVWLIRAYPAVFRRNLRPLGLATLLCILGAAFGYLVSRFKRARSYQQSYLKQLRSHFGDLAFDTLIPDLAQFEKSVTDRIPITLHAPGSVEAGIARRLFDEVESRSQGLHPGGARCGRAGFLRRAVAAA